MAHIYRVGMTPLAGVVRTTAGDSTLDPELPSRSKVSTLTSVTARVATGQQVVRSERELVLILRVDAPTIGEGLRSGNGPARSTAALVADLLQAGTLWPTVASVEPFRQHDVVLDDQNSERKSVLLQILAFGTGPVQVRWQRVRSRSPGGGQWAYLLGDRDRSLVRREATGLATRRAAVLGKRGLADDGQH